MNFPKSPQILILSIVAAVGFGAMYWANRERAPAPSEPQASSHPELIGATPALVKKQDAAESVTVSSAPNDQLAVARVPRVEAISPRSNPGWVATQGKRAASADSPTGPSPQRVALQKKAEKVEFEANRRLAQYSERLGLSEEQQDVIFPLIAAMSPSFVQGMEADGAADEVALATNTKELEEAIYETLDAEQREKLEEEIIDRDLWWDEILAVVDPANAPAVEAAVTEASVDESSAVDSSTTEEVAAPERVGGNIFDLLNGGAN